MATVVDTVITRFITQGDKDTHAAFGRLGVVATVAGAAFAFMGKAVLEAGKDQAAFTRAAGNFKGRFPIAEVEAFTGSLEKLTGIPDDAIAGPLGLLGTFQIGKQDAMALALPLLNAAEAGKAAGGSVESLALAVGKAVQTGEVGRLGRLGIVIDEVGFKAADTAGRVQLMRKALQARGGDAALAFRATLPGQVQALATSVGGLVESIGELASGPAGIGIEALIGLANTAKDIVDGFNDAHPVVKGFAQLVGVTLFGAMVKYTIQTGLAVLATQALILEQARLAGTGAVAGATAVATGAKAGPVGAAVAAAAVAGIAAQSKYAEMATPHIGQPAARLLFPLSNIVPGIEALAGGGAKPAADTKVVDLLAKIADNTKPGAAGGEGGAYWQNRGSLKNARMLGP